MPERPTVQLLDPSIPRQLPTLQPHGLPRPTQPHKETPRLTPLRVLAITQLAHLLSPAEVPAGRLHPAADDALRPVQPTARHRTIEFSRTDSNESNSTAV